MQNVYIFVQWDMLIEQLSMMDPKKPIHAVFLDVHQRQLLMGKQRVRGTALPCQHASDISAPCVAPQVSWCWVLHRRQEQMTPAQHW